MHENFYTTFITYIHIYGICEYMHVYIYIFICVYIYTHTHDIAVCGSNSSVHVPTVRRVYSNSFDNVHILSFTHTHTHTQMTLLFVVAIAAFMFPLCDVFTIIGLPSGPCLLMLTIGSLLAAICTVSGWMALVSTYPQKTPNIRKRAPDLRQKNQNNCERAPVSSCTLFAPFLPPSAQCLAGLHWRVHIRNRPLDIRQENPNIHKEPSNLWKQTPNIRKSALHICKRSHCNTLQHTAS